MPATNDLIIERAIIHKIDHLAPHNIVYSEIETPLNDDLRNFLIEQIDLARNHRYTRTGQFLALEEIPNGVIHCQEEADTILNTPDDDGLFVTHSKSLAEHLYDAIAGDGRVSKSDLIICLFKNRSNVEAELAVLKMEPHEAFVTRTINDDVRGTYVEVVRVPSVISNTEVQKCAFVVHPNLRTPGGYDLKVLDLQKLRGGIDRQAAGFFVTDFLQCKVNLNNTDATNVFIKESYAFASRHQENWTRSKVNTFKNAVMQAINGESVDVRQLAEAFIPEEDDRSQYIEHLQLKGLENLTFQPDASVAEKFNKFVKYKGDENLKLIIPQNFINLSSDDGLSEVTTSSTTLQDIFDSDRDRRAFVVRDNNEHYIIIRTVNLQREPNKAR